MPSSESCSLLFVILRSGPACDLPVLGSLTVATGVSSAIPLLLLPRPFCRLPIPPARLRPVQLVVLLDKRPVLRGFTWFLCEGEHFDLRGLQTTLQQEAPPGHRADITGGHRFLQDGRTRVMARSGQVLQVRFVPLRPLRRSPQASNADDPDDSSDDGDEAQDPGTSEEHTEAEESASASPGRRSRSPRPDGPRGPPPATTGPQMYHVCCRHCGRQVEIQFPY